MADVTYDTIDGAQVGTDRLTFRATRTGQIKGIDTTLSPNLILSAALAYLPAFGSSYGDPAYPAAILTRRLVEKLGGSNNKLRFSLFYESPNIPTGGYGTFILTHGRRAVVTQTELHPKDKLPMKFWWEHPDNPADSRPPTNANLTYFAAEKTITATGFYHGTPPAALDDAFLKVNDAPWQGRPKGYWLYIGGDDTTEDFGNNYAIRLEFLTRWTEDWSSYAIYRDPSTGLSLPVDPADATALKNQTYAYNFDDTKNGILKAGLYDTANFNSIFGF